MTDAELLHQFESCTLPGAAFHHEDHVRVAYLYLRKYPPLQALDRFSTSLNRFAIANAQPHLYNETITWAFLLLIRERLARNGQPQSWLAFAAANPDLLTWKNNVLKKYYRDETLASDLAKRTFLFPDKCPPLRER